MSEKSNLLVSLRQAGTRLDVFVTAAFPEASRSAVRRWIDGGSVTVDGKVRKAGHALRPQETVSVTPPPPQPVDLVPEPIPLDIVFEDDWLVVIDKPAGLVVHPGAGNRQGTLANALLHHLQQVSRSRSIRAGIVHRLDKGTSGLLVAAKNESVHQGLAAQFKQRQVEKRYLALVLGRLEPDQGRIEVPLGRHPRQRTRMSTRSRFPRQALTEYRVLRRFLEFTLAEVKLHTGRTHQIRVHFEHLGHPVAGDPTYTARRRFPLTPRAQKVLKGLDRPFLHAAGLAFDHPVTAKRLQFESPLPLELDEFLSSLE
ncbi:MAG: RluA family pseudouridine synthase [Acidobacteriota bacterium]